MCQQLIAADMNFSFFVSAIYQFFVWNFSTIKIVIPLKMCPFSRFCVSERVSSAGFQTHSFLSSQLTREKKKKTGPKINRLIVFAFVHQELWLVSFSVGRRSLWTCERTLSVGVVASFAFASIGRMRGRLDRKSNRKRNTIILFRSVNTLTAINLCRAQCDSS